MQEPRLLHLLHLLAVVQGHAVKVDPPVRVGREEGEGSARVVYMSDIHIHSPGAGRNASPPFSLSCVGGGTGGLPLRFVDTLVETRLP